LLVPAIGTGAGDMKLGRALGIEKRVLHVRQAWEVGVDDLEVTALLPDDDPIVPADKPDAPVILAMKRVHSSRWQQ
jgi:hypothetical protein